MLSTMYAYVLLFVSLISMVMLMMLLLLVALLLSKGRYTEIQRDQEGRVTGVFERPL